MDRMRPDYVRQKSLSSTSNSGESSPTMSSPLHRHARSGSTGITSMRKPHNTKAAAQRLAQVMAHQPADDEDDDDDLLYDYSPIHPSAGIGLVGGRIGRSPSPMSVRTSLDQPPAARSGTRASLPAQSVEQQPSSARLTQTVRSSQSNSLEQPPSAHSGVAGRSFQSTNFVEQGQPPSARSNSAGRLSQLSNVTEQPLSARSISGGRPNFGVKSVPMVPPSVPISLRSTVSGISAEVQPDMRKDSRLSLDFGTFKFKEPTNQRSSSALQDELDMLQEENESLLVKLRRAEERYEEAEVRARQLEKQVATLGEGVSLEARLLSRKEAALQQREAALKVATQTYGGKGEDVATLRMEVENAKDEASSALEQLHEAESEVKLLRMMTQRMILSHEEMEEVVLKRCWLAHYWSLCVHHGIHSDIAGARYEYWSSLAPLPVEVVLGAGQKAKDADLSVNNGAEEREKVPRDSTELSGEKSIESMLLVEKGLRELTSLKVEEAIALAMAQQRRPSALKSGLADDLKLPIEGQNSAEGFELSHEEAEDALFKQAWLTYFWRRAKSHGLEPDIAEERLQFWINQGTRHPTSNDAVDVERGLVELRKLGIESQLWEESRKYIDPDSNPKNQMGTEF